MVNRLQSIHQRKRGKKTFSAGSKLDAGRLMKHLQTTIELIEHYFKKKTKRSK